MRETRKKIMYEKVNNDRGSATVFMAVLLIPLMIFFCMIIRYAQLAAGKGAAADAISLADNAVCASYNKSIADAYGLTCYTDSAETMSGMAQRYANRSLNLDGQATVQVTYSGSLSDDRTFVEQIRNYMYDWDNVVPLLNINQLSELNESRTDAIEILNIFTQDLQAMEHSTYTPADSADIPEGTSPEEQQTEAERQQEAVDDAECGRQRALSGANSPDNVNLIYTSGPETATIAYGGGETTLQAYAPRFDSDVRTETNEQTEKNVYQGIYILQAATDYLASLDDVIGQQSAWSDSYYIALYARNNFSSFKHYGTGALTGNDYLSGDVTSVLPWGEEEFLATGIANREDSNIEVRNMIYDVMFMEYMPIVYEVVIENQDAQGIAQTLSNGNPELERLVLDELAVGFTGQLAYKALNQLCEFAPCEEIAVQNYPSYMELFLEIEATRNQGGLLSRLRCVIGENAKQSPSAEARKFTFENAGTAPVISGYSVKIKPSFGGTVTTWKQ